MLTRRLFLATVAAAGAVGPLPVWAADFEIAHTEAEWRKRLTPAQFAVLRDHETEQPFSNSLRGETSALLKEDRAGTYDCAGCALPVYASDTKYDSGTGWPSFWEALPNAVGYAADNSFFSRRTEVHCRRCGGHLGHVFDDGPKPTGKRHCLNGLAMTFSPA